VALPSFDPINDVIHSIDSILTGIQNEPRPNYLADSSFYGIIQNEPRPNYLADSSFYGIIQNEPRPNYLAESNNPIVPNPVSMYRDYDYNSRSFDKADFDPHCFGKNNDFPVIEECPIILTLHHQIEEVWPPIERTDH
jgi:hypothetical protein